MRSTNLRHVFRQVLSVSLLSPIAVVGAAACGASIEGTVSDGGSAGDGGSAADAAKSDGSLADASGGSCEAPNSPRWNKPGCARAADVCYTPGTAEPNCYTVVCGCSGKVIGGCNAFPEPYVPLPGSFGANNPFPEVGSACNPAPIDAGKDAAPDGCVTVPEPAADAGVGCTSWTVPLPCSFPSDASSVTTAECQAYCGSNAYFCSKALDVEGTLRCDPGCAVGRRPEGFASTSSSRSGDASTITGLYFAAMAELEAASVFSFERLARELESHGAPASLRKRALRAAEDERRHARVASALANRFGGETRSVAATSMDVRSLEAMALENAVEGCVRETFGALTATLQAERAGDARVKAAMRRIAVDETAHAGLAWAVAEWLDTQLSEEAKVRVAVAKATAIDELRHEVCTPQPTQLEHIAGLPSANEAGRMLDAMTRSLWAA